MAKLRANGRWTVPGASGELAVGWKVNCYIAGTTTRKDTYTDNTASTPNANPVILDSRGEATIYWSGTYKVIVTDEDDVTVWEEDDYGKGEAADPVDTFNKTINGSFELDSIATGEPDNWTLVDYSTGVHSLDSTDQYSGLKSLKFTSVGSGGGYATSDYFEVEEGKQVSVVWAMKSSVADVRNVVDILWATSAQAAISTTNIYDDSTTNPTAWTSKSGTGVPPSTARYAQLRIYGCHSSDATAGSTWYDNIVTSADAAIRNGPNTFTATQTWAKGSDVASASALTLGDGNYFDITGTTDISTIVTKGVGTVIKLHFNSQLKLIYNASFLVLPLTSDLVMAAGEEAELIEISSGKWRLINSYAAGLWTPTIQDTSFSDAEGQTYSVQLGTYVKTGNLVTVQGRLTITSLGTISGASAIVGGLPFDSVSVGGINIHDGSGFSITAGVTATGFIFATVSYITLQQFSATTGTAALPISALTNSTSFNFSGQYVV